MSDRDTGKPSHALTSWLDPEAIAYALVGLLVIGLGARALARWAFASWADGERTILALVVTACSLAILTLLVLLRGRRRYFYLGIALALVGAVSFALASLGIHLPHWWLE